MLEAGSYVRFYRLSILLKAAKQFVSLIWLNPSQYAHGGGEMANEEPRMASSTSWASRQSLLALLLSIGVGVGLTSIVEYLSRSGMAFSPPAGKAYLSPGSLLFGSIGLLSGAVYYGVTRDHHGVASLLFGLVCVSYRAYHIAIFPTRVEGVPIYIPLSLKVASLLALELMAATPHYLGQTIAHVVRRLSEHGRSGATSDKGFAG